MKGLKQFLQFNTGAFFDDKKIMVLNVEPYYAYVDGNKTDQKLGTKINAIISSDNTKYSDDKMDNLFEKISFKMPGIYDVNIKKMSRIKITKFEKVVVYGQYQNQLSIEISKFEILKDNV